MADFDPVLIHIHGTEHLLAKAVCMANESGIQIVANVQDLAGPYMRYADGELSLWNKFKHRIECERYVLTYILSTS